MTPADEIRAAAARLRDTEGVDGHRLDSDSRELLAMVRVLLRAREPLADWLELEADVIAARTAADGGGEHAVDISGDHALAVARAVNSPAEPGHALGGPIADHVTGRRT